MENVYTQHAPLLKDILEEIFKGRIQDHQYPIVGSELPPFRRPPHQVIVFIIGGTTYEEALSVHNLNSSTCNVVLGGTTIHNSKSFLDEVLSATNGITFKHTRTLQAYHSPEGV